MVMVNDTFYHDGHGVDTAAQLVLVTLVDSEKDQHLQRFHMAAVDTAEEWDLVALVAECSKAVATTTAGGITGIIVAGDVITIGIIN
jgi:hypothetical protein